KTTLGDVTGAEYGLADTRTVPHDAIQAALADGRPVPFGVDGHAMVLTGHFPDPEGDVYLVRDPESADTRVVTAAQLDEMNVQMLELPGAADAANGERLGARAPKPTDFRASQTEVDRVLAEGMGPNDGARTDTS